MLRVTVDIVPLGYEDAKRTLYKMEIVNIGSLGITYTKSGDPRYSYKVRTYEEGEKERKDHGIVVRGFDRKRPLTDLIKKILDKMDKNGNFKK